MSKHSQDQISVLIANNSEEIGARLFEILSECEQVEVVGAVRNGTQDLTIFNKHVSEEKFFDLYNSGLGDQEILIAFWKLSHSSILSVVTNRYETQQACLQSGADCFLVKSYQFERVAELIGKLEEVTHS